MTTPEEAAQLLLDRIRDLEKEVKELTSSLAWYKERLGRMEDQVRKDCRLRNGIRRD